MTTAALEVMLTADARALAGRGEAAAWAFSP